MIFPVCIGERSDVYPPEEGRCATPIATSYA